MIPEIPSGNYKIVPVFLKNVRNFTIRPSDIDATVVNFNVVLNEQFTVTEFSIKGRVLSPTKTGIKDVRIKLDAKELTKSDADGEYTLDTVRLSIK